MEDDRFNTITGVFGARGSGKTLYMLGSEYSSNPKDKPLKVPGLLKLYKEKKIKTLYVDTLNHPSYRNLPLLSINQAKNFTSGVARVIVRAEDVPKLNKFLNALPNMWNTHLVYEDAYKHTFRSIDRSLIELMADSKQKNIDITFMYHAFSQAPPDLYRMLDYIQLFKTKDSPKSRAEHMPGYYEEAERVYNIVKSNKNPFFHKLIDTGL